MFDLKNIKFIKNDDEYGRKNYSFVGIQRSRENKEQLEFWLPLGFKDFNHEDFNEVKSFFFKMYKTFRAYLKKKESQLKIEDITIDRDGIIEKGNGFSFIKKNKAESLFYGKLNSLEKILDGYNELRISALENKLSRSNKIDYSKLHRYLHQAIYLEDDVVYLEEMNIAKSIIVKSSPPILQLFCFLYTEIKIELQEEYLIPSRAYELAEQFKEVYLYPESKLFEEDSYLETIEVLKEVLERVDTETIYKDEDYWHFFEAVEEFLFGERQENNDDIYWGFNSFYDIWEDMCQTFVLNTPKYRNRVAFADVNGKLKNVMKFNLNPFELLMNDLVTKRRLKPDLVIVNTSLSDDQLFWTKPIEYGKKGKEAFAVHFRNYGNIEEKMPWIIDRYKEIAHTEAHRKTGKPFRYMFKTDLIKFKQFLSEVRIIDYKYMRISDYQEYSPYYVNSDGENKVKDDIQKQLIYEWSVQQNWKAKTQSEFWIPFFSEDKSIIEKKIEITNPYFNESKIELIGVNFNAVQEYYLKHVGV